VARGVVAMIRPPFDPEALAWFEARARADVAHQLARDALAAAALPPAHDPMHWRPEAPTARPPRRA